MSQQSDIDAAAAAISAQATQINSDLDAIKSQVSVMTTIKADILANAGSLTVSGLTAAVDAVKTAAQRVA